MQFNIPNAKLKRRHLEAIPCMQFADRTGHVTTNCVHDENSTVAYFLVKQQPAAYLCYVSLWIFSVLNCNLKCWKFNM